LVPLLDELDELDPQPAASNARALTPTSVNRCDDLTRILLSRSPSLSRLFERPRYCKFQEISDHSWANGIRP
jgi:hypothetical protein